MPACAVSELVPNMPQWARCFYVRGVKQDSRHVERGDAVFVDNVAHVKDAISRGAAVVFAPQGSAAQIEGGGLVVELDDFRHAAGRAAARFYGHPSRAMYTIGVTGTNGKTSVCWWLQQLLSLLGEKVGSVGTLGVRSSVDEAFDNTGFTTPLAADLQAILADVRTKGTQTLVLEASSHGIEQGRISGCNFNQAVFTNLTQDHLDFHPSMEAYAATKKKLFSWPDLRGMTVNIDDLVGQEIWSQGAAVERVSYALENPQADVRPAQLPIQRGAYQTGLEFEIVSPWGSGSLYCPHVQGKHNAYNVLAVIAVAGQKGYPLDRLLDAAQALTPPPGRLQSAIPHSEHRIADIEVLIDYAHTPDAVAAIVDSACASERPVWVVLGCGGDRDRSKRPLMAKASSAADQLVFTSDNPRSESPQRIVEDMLQGCENQRSVHVDLDRRSAISWAVRNAPDGATLLILGKGHESVQIIDDTRVPFSDVEVAFEALQVEGRLR